jgi:hypothetical protein
MAVDEGRAEEAELTMGEILDRGARRITTGLVIAGAFVGLGLYSQPGPQRYQAFETDSGIVRLNTKSGDLILCDGQKCTSVHRRGQKIDRTRSRLLPAPAAPPAPAQAPAPAQPALPKG